MLKCLSTDLIATKYWNFGGRSIFSCFCRGLLSSVAGVFRRWKRIQHRCGETLCNSRTMILYCKLFCVRDVEGLFSRKYSWLHRPEMCVFVFVFFVFRHIQSVTQSLWPRATVASINTVFRTHGQRTKGTHAHTCKKQEQYD